MNVERQMDLTSGLQWCQELDDREEKEETLADVTSLLLGWSTAQGPSLDTVPHFLPLLTHCL